MEDQAGLDQPTQAAQLWRQPTGDAQVRLEVRGNELFRLEGGRWQPARGYAEEQARVRAELRQYAAQPLTLSDLWPLRDGWVHSLGAAGARARWEKEGLPGELWDRLAERHPLPGPEARMASEGYSSVLTVEDAEAEQNLGLSPESQARVRELLFGVPVADLPTASLGPAPDAGDLLWAERPGLERAGFAPFSPRRADGRLWLPPAWEARRAEWETRQRPVLRAIPVRGTGQAVGRWESKLGGVPDRPRGAEWPHSPGGAPLRFLAQINLTQANADGHLADFPRRGLLQFFLAQPREDKGSVGRVLYSPELAVDPARPTHTPPDFGDDHGEEFNPPERRLALLPDEEFPNALDLPTPQGLPEATDPHPAGHRVGGWPMVINATTAPDEQVLFQFDGDDLGRVLYGDWGGLGGWLAFTLSTDDLRAGRFERARLMLDAF